MDLSALFKITYGLFVVGVESNGKLNGCIINTASQVTAEPPRVIITMQKANLTSDMVREKGSCALSVLSRSCSMDIIKNFGYQSGRQADKFLNIPYVLDALHNPLLKEAITATVSLKIEKTVDVDTHWLFICSVEDCAVQDDSQSLTYEDYRVLKDGGSLLEPQTGPRKKKYVCPICHYVYDGDVPFEDLPDDFVCPICNAPKSLFVLE